MWARRLSVLSVVLGAIAVAWSMPTTATARSCGKDPCAITYPHLLLRGLVLVVGAIVAMVLMRLSRSGSRPRGNMAFMTSGLMLVSATALLVAIRLPAGLRSYGPAFITDGWFVFRTILAAEGFLVVISATTVLASVGGDGKPGLQVLALGVPLTLLVAFAFVPSQLTCPSGPWYPSDAVHRCIDISRSLAPPGPSPPISVDRQVPVRIAFVIGAIASRLAIVRMRDALPAPR
jgi:hypothetical protein